MSAGPARRATISHPEPPRLRVQACLPQSDAVIDTSAQRGLEAAPAIVSFGVRFRIAGDMPVGLLFPARHAPQVRASAAKRAKKGMTLKRMDNVLIVVDDLEAVKSFFIELGLKLEGESTVEGPLV